MATANADGSIILSVQVDTGDLQKGTKSLKSQAATLAAEYRKAGMSQSESFKKAWSEIERTKKETDGAKKQTKKYGDQAQKSGAKAKSAFFEIGNALGRLALVAAAAFSFQKLIQFGKEASSLATQTEASVQRLIDIYGQASQAVGDFIDANALALGLSRSAAASYASIYGNLFSVWADQETNAALTMQYLQMTAVVASKTGRTVEDVQERIRSGLLGNTEAIEDLGVFVNVKMIEMTDAFQRMAAGKSWEQLDAYTQQQIRSMAILEQATEKYGNEVANTTVLSESRFRAAWEDFQATWGQMINQVLVPILNILTDILITATRVIQTIFGLSGATISQSDAIANSTSNQKEFTDAVKETAKEQKKAVAGFDEIEKLTNSAQEAASETSSDIGVGGGIVGGGSKPVGNTDATSVFDGIGEKIQGFLGEFSTVWNDISSLGSPISAWFTEDFLGFVRNFAATLADTLGLAFSGIGSAFNELWTTVLFPTLSRFTTEGLPKVTEFLNMALTNFSGFRDSVALVLGDVWNLALLPMLQTFSTTGLPMLEDFTWKAVGAFNNLYNEFKALFDLIWQDAIAPALTQISIIWDGLWTGLKDSWDKWGDPIFDGINEAIDGTAAFLNTMWNEWIKPVWDKFMATVDEVWTNHLKPLWNKITDFVGHLAAEALNIYNKFILPILNWLSKVLKPLWDFWWDKVFSVVKTAFASIKALISPLIDAFSGLVDFISGIFTGDLEKAFGGIKEFFRGLINTIIGFFESFVNFFVEAINLVTGGISLVSGAIGDLIGVDLRIPEVSKVTLPRLATGAVIPPNREFLAVLGDQKSGTNIEAPLETIVQAMRIALAESNASKGEAYMVIDEQVFGRLVYRYNNSERNRIGVSLAGGMA